MISIGENTPEKKCKKKYKKIEFYLSKFSTGDHPKKYQSICDITNCSVCSFKQRLDRYDATSTVFRISPALLDTTTAWMVETAYNGGHFVMT